MTEKIILDLCGGSGAWSKPFADAGFIVYNLTLPKYDLTGRVSFDRLNGRIIFDAHTNKGLDYTKIDLKEIYGILAAPPCTMFSLARTRAKAPRDFNEGMKLVRACLNIIWEIRARTKIKFWALENPMGYLRQFLGKPALTFDPCDFGDPYTKKTDLWGYFAPPRKSQLN